MPPRAFAPPQSNVSHFHDEATVQHEASCALVQHARTFCTCRRGPVAGTAEGLLMEGPELQFRRFDGEGNASALEAEVAELRAEVARLRGDAPDAALGVVDAPFANRFGKVRRGRA